MTNNYIDVFNDSFDRCSNDPKFLDRFYDLFFASSNEVKEKFENTDMVKQKAVLLKTFSYLMIANKKPELLAKTALSHSSGHLDIKPHLYTLWLDCMVQAVQETDIRFDADIEKSWRTVMQPGIDYMISRYR